MIEIKNRFDGKILFSGDFDSVAKTVIAAIKSEADLSWADRIRKRLMEITIRSPAGDDLRPVLSCGVAMCEEEVNGTIDGLVKTTSEALARARHHGGDRVIVFQPA